MVEPTLSMRILSPSPLPEHGEEEGEEGDGDEGGGRATNTSPGP